MQANVKNEHPFRLPEDLLCKETEILFRITRNGEKQI
jgi:hypothetical protein